MTKMQTVQEVLTWAAIAAGLASAWLWYKASTTTVLKGDPRSRGGFLIGNRDGTQLDVYSTVYESSKVNAQAAIATALAVGLQAIGTIVGKLG